MGSAFWVLQIQLDALLVAVEHGEKPRTRAQQMAGSVARYGLNLDDLGPHIGQHHAASGAHDHVGELHHTQTFEGQFPVNGGHGSVQR